MPKLEVTDLVRLDVQPGEVLVVRIPRGLPRESVDRSREVFAERLREAGLEWPVLFTFDDVEFTAIDGRKLMAAPPPDTRSWVRDG